MKSLKVISLLVLLLGVSGCLRTRAELGDSRSKEEVQSQQVQAQKEMKQIEIDDQMRQLNGRIESLENQLVQTQQALQAQTQGQAGEKSIETQKIQLLEQAVEKLDLRLMALSNEIKVYLKSKPKKRAKSSSASKGNYARAEDAFKAKKWKEAIVGYEKYRELNPKGRRYASSTYKIGVCFQELKMGDAAKSFYQEVLDKFPKSSDAKKAKYRLSKLR